VILDLGFVHGLSTDVDDVHAPRIKDQLIAAGVSVGDVVDIDWDSSGIFTMDVAKFTFRSTSFRWRAVQQVHDQIVKLMRGNPDVVILCHSMGCPLALTASHRIVSIGGKAPHLLFVGPPFGHLVNGRWLRSLGLIHPPRDPIHAFWNRDDPICCFRDVPPTFDDWIVPHRVAVPDHLVRPFTTEHDLDWYVEHPVFISHLLAIGGAG
jgi:hypothetical protein